MSVNKVILIGRLGQNPELKYTPNGMAVCNFNMATSEAWKDKSSGQKMEKTEWHRVVVWSKLAELCNQYLSKGRQVFVEGRLRTRTWDDKEGNKRYTTEILAQSIQFIGGNNSQGGVGSTASAGSEAGGMDSFGGFGDSDYFPGFDDGPASSTSSTSNSSSSQKGKGRSNNHIPLEDQFSPDELPF